jgi:hypothetical protein
MGGKAIGGSNMPTDLKKKFEAFRAAGDMDKAHAIADRVQKFNDDKKAQKAKSSNVQIKRDGNTLSVKSERGDLRSVKVDDAFIGRDGTYKAGSRVTGNWTDPTGTSHKIDKVVTPLQMANIMEYVRTGKHDLDTFQINKLSKQNQKKKVGQLLKEGKSDSSGSRPISYKGQNVASVKKINGDWVARGNDGKPIYNESGGLMFNDLASAKLAIANKYNIE